MALILTNVIQDMINILNNIQEILTVGHLA